MATAVWLGLPWSILPAPGAVPYDTAFTVLQLDHLQHAALGDGAWDRGPLGWPLAGSTALTDWLGGVAVFGLPLHVLGLDPQHTHDLLVLAGLIATGFAGHRVAQALVGPGAHTAIAGLALGLGPVQIGHAQHLNLVHHEGTVLAAALLGWGLLGDRRLPAALGGLIWGLGWHLGLYLGLQTTLVVVAVAGVAAWTRRASAWTWAAAAVAAVAGAVTVLPVAWLYAGVAAEHAVTLTAGVLRPESFDPIATLRPLDGALLHLPVAGRLPAPNPANPGYTLLALAALGGWQLRRAWRPAWGAVLVAAVLAALLALGPTVVIGGFDTAIPGPYAVLAAIPGLDGLRTPNRLLWIAHAAVALLACLGVAHAATRWTGWRRTTWLVGVVGLVWLELPRNPRTPAPYPPVPALYDDVAASDVPGVVVDEAVAGEVTCACRGSLALRGALAHHRPLVGGVYARRIPELDTLGKAACRFPEPRAEALVRALGVGIVIEHPPVRRAAPAGWRCKEYPLSSGMHRVCLAR